jgi:lipopolysaccharide transport system permease protein
VATIPWQLFSSSLSESSSSLIANSNLITKVYFPRIIIPVSTIMVCLADFMISLIILAGLMMYFGTVPGPEVFLLPLFVLLAVFASLGLGLFLAALNVKYRDFRYVVPFVVQLGLFVSPIAINSYEIYGSSTIPDIVKGLYSLNPMVAVIDGFRFCLLGTEWIVNPTGLILSLSSSVILLILGIWYFRKTERGFADII